MIIQFLLFRSRSNSMMDTMVFSITYSRILIANFTWKDVYFYKMCVQTKFFLWNFYAFDKYIFVVYHARNVRPITLYLCKTELISFLARRRALTRASREIWNNTNEPLVDVIAVYSSDSFDEFKLSLSVGIIPIQ